MPLFAPATREKLSRFRKMKRAYISFWLLISLLVVSLFSELIANATPWLVKFEGQLYCPPLNKNLTQGDFTGEKLDILPRYYELSRSELFAEGSGNWMLWSPIPFGPGTNVSPDWIELPDVVEIRREPYRRVAAVQINSSGRMRRRSDSDWAFAGEEPELPEEIQSSLDLRFSNQPAEAILIPDPSNRFEWSMPAYAPRSSPPRSARMTLREIPQESSIQPAFEVAAGGDERPKWWASLPGEVRKNAEVSLQAAVQAPVDAVVYQDEQGRSWQIQIYKETVQYPFRPVEGHPLGLDNSGKDVRVLILYATRIGLLFGLILVVCSLLLGTLIGGIQGYFGGKIDMFGQRMIEIYSAIPFLYAMIFLGNVFGRSFGLLLLVYALFNWIGISYYMRAEFLRLRKQPFTEAALSLGLPTGKIMWKHILPNALIPLITFFPFNLVGAIGSLSALDYLGFGLPPGTPSWGNLLGQAQVDRHAWWLILYPSIMLFLVVLLGVFVGEGLRAAFDPKREAHWEA